VFVCVRSVLVVVVTHSLNQVRVSRVCVCQVGAGGSSHPQLAVVLWNIAEAADLWSETGSHLLHMDAVSARVH
jgi:hypothetical protein